MKEIQLILRFMQDEKAKPAAEGEIWLEAQILCLSMTWGSFILFFITQNRSAPIKQRFRTQPGALGRSNCNLSGSLHSLR